MTSSDENRKDDSEGNRLADRKANAVVDASYELSSVDGLFYRGRVPSTGSPHAVNLRNNHIDDWKFYHSRMEKYMAHYAQVRHDLKEISVGLEQSTKISALLENEAQALKLDLAATEQNLWDSICICSNRTVVSDPNETLDSSRTQSLVDCESSDGPPRTCDSGKDSESQMNPPVTSTGGTFSPCDLYMKIYEFVAENPTAALGDSVVASEEEPVDYNKMPLFMALQWLPDTQALYDPVIKTEDEDVSDDRQQALMLGYELVDLDAL